MKKIALYLLSLSMSFLYCSASYGQGNKTKDSLLAVAYKKKPDSSSVKAMQTILRNFFNAGEYDSTFRYAQELIALTKKMNDKKELAKAYFNLGTVCSNLTMYDSARHYTELAEHAAMQAGDSFLLVNCYNTFATQYRYQSDFNTSLDYAIKGASIAERSSDSAIIKMIPMLYANIGNCLNAENQLEKAIVYEKKALKFTNYYDEKRFRILLQLDIADAYIKLGDFESAKEYVANAVKENELLDNVIVDILTFNTQGFYYYSIGNYDAALAAYRQSYDLCGKTNNDYLEAESANNVADILLKQKKYEQALPFAEKANSISIRLKHFKVAASSFNSLGTIAVAKGDYKTALQYAELNKRYADSATNEATQKQTLSLEKKYQSQKKEKEIADLTIVNTEQELEAVKRNRFLAGGSIALLSLLIILALLYRNSKQKQLLAAKEQTLNQDQIKFLERQQQVLSLQSMVKGQETERSRISKDLHDGLGGLFSTIKMYFSTLQYEEAALQNNALFAKSYELIDTASEEIRRIAHNMMPEVLMKLGLMHAVKDMCSNISAGKLLDVKLQSYGMEKRMNVSTEVMLYRIVQELLNNIIKHAQATHVIVQFNREPGRLTVTVEDNGRGFNPQEIKEDNHIGLETIRSRVNYLNGNISIDSEVTVGTTVLMEFLINDESEAA